METLRLDGKEILRLARKTNRGCSIRCSNVRDQADFSVSLPRVSELAIASQQFVKLFGLYCLSCSFEPKTGANSLSLLSARHGLGE